MRNLFGVIKVIVYLLTLICCEGNDYNVSGASINNNVDEDMMACTDEWRAMHPYDYNPFEWENPYGEIW